MEGVFRNISAEREPDLCFVMMPFSEQFNATYRLIERCCTEQGLRCERADSDVRPGKITGKIYDYIRRAGIVVADMTGRNPNVFYELGLAHAISDTVVLLTQSGEDVPFDLKDFLHIQYTNSFEGAERLANDLSKVLTRIARSATIPASSVALASRVPSATETAVEDIEDLDLLQLQADLSRKGGDVRQAKAYLERALELANLGQGEAGEIGNCAIEAERQGFRQLAEALYRVAVERDPGHVNNRQCYVSFLLDEYPRDEGRLAVASQILGELAKVPERQERTKALRAQYATIVSPTKDGEDVETILKDLKAGADFTSLQAAGPLLSVLEGAGRHDELREVLNIIKQNVGEQERLDCDRVLADALAQSGRSEHEKEAIVLYQSIVDKSLDERPAVLHNLATLLYQKGSRENEERAAGLWREAYQALAHDVRMRKAFAQCLLRLGHHADAKKVLAGEPLREQLETPPAH